MIKCPVCGFRNPDINDQCFKCNAGLKHNEEMFEAGKASARAKAKNLKLEKIKDKFSPVTEEEQNYSPYKYPFTAGGLSLLPGAGHLYLGQTRRGIIFITAAVIAILIGLLTIKSPISNFILLGFLFLWVYVITDAIKLAAVNNCQAWSVRSSFAVFTWLLFAVGALVLTFQFAFRPSLTFVRMQTNVLAPYILNKDLVVVNKLAYYSNVPQYNDIIMFDPARMVSEQGLDVISVNLTEYFQKVIGKEGDTIVKKDGKFYRNGQILPENAIPFHGDKLHDFELTVGSGKIFAPITAIPGDSFMGFEDLGYVGQNISFDNWAEASQISINEEEGSKLLGKVMGILDPPPSRQWF